MMQDSSAILLAGRNPYTAPTAGLDGFVYWPIHLLLPLPFYLLLGDTRFGSIFWEGVGISAMYALARAELRPAPKLVHLAELALLLFVLQPRNLFVIEQSWGEPLMVGLTAITFYFFYYQPRGPLADISLGVLLAIKQYLIFMLLPLFILYDRNWKRYALTLLVIGVIFLPFIIWNPAGFYAQTITHFFRLPIQTDALGLTAYFYEQGILLPRWLGPILAAIAVALGLLLKRFAILGYLHTIILCFFTLFLLGQQAFANYYYFISFMQAIALVFFLVYQFARPANHAQI
jgi:hypothetical protein